MMRARHVGRALDELVKFWAQESWELESWSVSGARIYILLELRPKFAFSKNLCYNKRLGVELGARVIPKVN